MAKVKKSELAKVAEELNGALGLEPKIETKGTKSGKLKEMVQEAYELVQPEDKISSETVSIMESLAEEMGGKEEAPHVEEPEEEEPLVQEEKDEGKKEKKKEGDSRAHTRLQAAVIAVKELEGPPADVESVAKKADEIYVGEGGSSNLKESRWAVNAVIQVLKEYGALTEEER